MNISRRDFFHAIINRVALDRFKARVFNHPDQLGFRHFLFAAFFDRIAVRQLAAVGNRAVDVVGAEMQRGLRRRFAEHHPIGFDVVEIIEHQARDGDCFQIVDRVRSRQAR